MAPMPTACICSTSPAARPVVIDSVNTLVLCTGHVPVTDLADSIEDLPIDVRIIGDAAAPRTAEEAVYEGFRAGAEI